MKLVLVIEDEDYVWEQEEESSFKDEIIYVYERNENPSGFFLVPLEDNHYSYVSIP